MYRGVARFKKLIGVIAACFFLASCMLFAAPGLSWGDEMSAAGNAASAALELTLDEAVNRALAKSNTLKSAEYDIERSEEVRESAADKVKYIPAGPTPDAAAAAFTNLVAKDLAWQMSKKTKDVKADAITLSVFQAYINVLAAQEKVAAAEKALADADWKRWAARVGYQVGTVSLSGKLTAEVNYDARAAALASARAALEDAYHKLNQLVGLNPDDRPVLKDQPQLIPIKVDDLEAEIQRRVEESPSVWLAERNVELARLALDLYDWTNPNREPYRAKEIDVTKAELSAADAKDQLRQQLRSIYQNIVQIEQDYASLEQSLKLAQENLRIKKVYYEVGMATKGDLLAAEADVASLQLALRAKAYQHEVLKLAFDKPWAYSGGSSSGS